MTLLELLSSLALAIYMFRNWRRVRRIEKWAKSQGMFIPTLGARWRAYKYARRMGISRRTYLFFIVKDCVMFWRKN